MSYAYATSQYLESDILSRPREWLVPLLYEHLLANLRRAAVQIESRDFEGKASSLSKANQIVAELLATLDRERGGDVADALVSLYGYFAIEIMNVGRTLDLGTLNRLVAMIADLHEAWVQAAEQVAPRGARSTATEAISAA